MAGTFPRPTKVGKGGSAKPRRRGAGAELGVRRRMIEPYSAGLAQPPLRPLSGHLSPASRGRGKGWAVIFCALLGAIDANAGGQEEVENDKPCRRAQKSR
ncbi:hypothetical protein MPLSOD_40269 [Mesorhizobium sp. SOD10]|nr:hypothetical protein MPLSOD_40269 [Mesorhizobium sp. SOD10]